MVDTAADSTQPTPTDDVATRLMSETERDLAEARERELGMMHEDHPVFEQDPDIDDIPDDVPISVVMARRGPDWQEPYDSTAPRARSGRFTRMMEDALQEDGAQVPISSQVPTGMQEGGAQVPTDVPGRVDDMADGQGEDIAQGFTGGMAEGEFSQGPDIDCGDAEFEDLLTRLDPEAECRPRAPPLYPSIWSGSPDSHVPASPAASHPVFTPRVPDPGPSTFQPPFVPRPSAFRPPSDPGPSTVRPPPLSRPFVAPRHTAAPRVTTPPPLLAPRPMAQSSIPPTAPAVVLYEYRPPEHPFRASTSSVPRSRGPSLADLSQQVSAWQVPSQPGQLHGDDEGLTGPTQRKKRGRPKGALNKKGKAPRGRGTGRRGRPRKERGGDSQEEPDFEEGSGETSPSDCEEGISVFEGRTYHFRESARGPEAPAEDPDETQPF